MVYLLHFTERYGKGSRPGHYTGYCDDERLAERVDEHAKGRGARLMEVVTDAGIGFVVARTWDGDRKKERSLKKQGGASRHCPVCMAAKKAAR